MATCCFVGISKSGFVVRGRKKDGLLMHVFFVVFFHFSLSLLFVISLSTLSVSFLSRYPLSFMAIVPLYIGLSLCDFSILPLLLTDHFCLL